MHIRIFLRRVREISEVELNTEELKLLKKNPKQHQQQKKKNPETISMFKPLAPSSTQSHELELTQQAHAVLGVKNRAT